MWVIGLVVVIVVAIVVGAVLVRRRRPSADTAGTTVAPSTTPPPDDAPMTDLEAALARATGRDGRPISEHIDAETQHVDELRVPDDTGPLLRRALDHVEHHGDEHHGDATASSPADHPAVDDD